MSERVFEWENIIQIGFQQISETTQQGFVKTMKLKFIYTERFTRMLTAPVWLLAFSVAMQHRVSLLIRVIKYTLLC